MGRLLHLVKRGGDWAGPQPAQAHLRCTKCNSPPINGQCTNHCILLYNGPLLCGFNVCIKGLKAPRRQSVMLCQRYWKLPPSVWVSMSFFCLELRAFTKKCRNSSSEKSEGYVTGMSCIGQIGTPNGNVVMRIVVYNMLHTAQRSKRVIIKSCIH